MSPRLASATPTTRMNNDKKFWVPWADSPVTLLYSSLNSESTFAFQDDNALLCDLFDQRSKRPRSGR